MLQTLIDSMNLDRDYPLRSRNIDVYTRILNGTLYDHLQYSFFDENSGSDAILMKDKRPAIKYNLCRIVMDELISLLFGSDHFPQVHCGIENKQINEHLLKLINGAKIRAKLCEASLLATTGSSAIFASVKNQKLILNKCIRPY